jgi:DNA repair protein RecO
MKTKTKATAFVLRKKALPQRDYFVVLLTKELGKIHCIAKGSRSLTSKRSPHLQTGNLIEVQLSQFAGNFMVEETSLSTGFGKIKNNLTRLNYLYTYFFVIDKLLPVEAEEERIYKLTMNFLSALSDREIFTIHETLQYLRRAVLILGYEYSGSESGLFNYIEEIINTKIPYRDIM